MKQTQGERENNTSLMYGTAQQFDQGQSELYPAAAFNPTNDFQLNNMEWQTKEQGASLGFNQHQFTSGEVRKEETSMGRFPAQSGQGKSPAEQSGSSQLPFGSYGRQNSYNCDFNSNISSDSVRPCYTNHLNRNLPQHLSSQQGNQTLNFERSFQTTGFPHQWAHRGSVQPFASRRFTQPIQRPTKPYNYPGTTLGAGTDVDSTSGNVSLTHNNAITFLPAIPMSNLHEMRNNPGMGHPSSRQLSRKLSNNSSNSMLPDVAVAVTSMRSGNDSSFPTPNENQPGSFASTQEFEKNSVIRSLQIRRSMSDECQQGNPKSSTTISTTFYNYFDVEKSGERIVPPVVKVEAGCDKPVPAKRTTSLTHEKSSKPAAMTSNNSFGSNWLQRSESQRLMEEQLAAIAENLNPTNLAGLEANLNRGWDTAFYPDKINAGKLGNDGSSGTTQDAAEVSYKCEWSGCGLVFSEQDDLVRHIEKVHIDQRKADDSFVCFWENCVRKQKPFNARYKLVIHMRVHSGERPNRCTVSRTTFIPLFSHFLNYI